MGGRQGEYEEQGGRYTENDGKGETRYGKKAGKNGELDSKG